MRLSTRAVRLIAVPLIASAVVLSCEPPTEPVPVGSVVITGSTTSVIVGQNLPLTAEVRSTDNDPLPGRPVTWSSNANAVATVSTTGLVTTHTTGNATISATSGGVTGNYNITVIPVPVATVEVSPPTPTIIVGATQQLTATTKDAGGNTLTGRVVTWLSATPATATVSVTGLVTGIAPGTVIITATSETIDGTSTVTVNPIPIASVEVTPAVDTLLPTQSLQLAAQPKSGTGAPLMGRVVTWSSLDTARATVNATGLVTAKTLGTVTVRATSEGVIGDASIVMEPLPVDSVAVTPSDVALHPTQTSQLTATTYDSTGAELSGRAVTWSSSDTTVATVNSTGLVTAVAVGAATITATSEGVSGVAEFVVQPVPVSYVELTPANPIILTGTSTQLTATPRDSVGGALVRAISWTSLDTTIATVNGTGLVTGVAVGFIGIVATSESKADTSVVDVNPVPVDSLAISPARDTIFVGATVQLAVTAFDSAGNVLTGRDVNWGSITGAFASVNASGLVSGHAAGTEQIKAHVITTGARGTSVTDTISALITVLPIPVDSIVIRLWNQATEPTAFGTIKGATTPLMALNYDSLGNALFRPVTWSSTDSTLVAVNDTGLVTGVGTGTAYIVAESEGVRDSVLVTSNVLDFTEVHSGPLSACGLTAAGAAWCWGHNIAKELGISYSGDTALAVPVSGGLTFTALTVSGKYTSNLDDGGFACGITPAGAMYCWGNNSRGTLGNGMSSSTPSESPQLVLGGLTFTQVSAGSRNTCGITADSSAYCWGLNELTYAVGDSTQTNRTTPTLVAGGHKWISISTGADFVCGLVAGGIAYCWGSDVRGQLGNGLAPPGQCQEDGLNDFCRSPAPVTGGHTFAQISAGAAHVCGIATDNKTYCWGNNPDGQVGPGYESPDSASHIEVPTEVAGGHTFVYVMAAGDFSCALTAAGAAYCWGANGNYQLGTGTQVYSSSPTPVVGAPAMATLTSRGGNAINTCGISQAGDAWCWGEVGVARGIGIRTLNPTSLGPTKVLGQP